MEQIMKITPAQLERLESNFNKWRYDELEKIAYDHPRGDSSSINQMKRDMKVFKQGMLGELPVEWERFLAEEDNDRSNRR